MLLLLQAETNNDISDNNWLDQFRILVGEWFTQTVDWIDGELGWLLNAIKWPFQSLFDLIMNENVNRTSIMSISWVWLVLGFFVLGSVLRNTRIGFMAAIMVAACGFLGQDFWFETSKTFGMIFISVFLCAAIGLPLGILCGRLDPVWKVTRPVLDSMQVIHSFVWMLPFIAFWGIGNVSATMVTMMFALPPLVRLTNLGIRQVPEDIVEASRSYGATEFRVLTDVQLPLARPAIMTGLNQTLLLAISMLGIAAFMGADGLGRLIFRAINNLDTALAASAGLAFFFVAVVLDRISQPEEDDGLSLFGRIGNAWAHRRNPEDLLANVHSPDEADTESERLLIEAAAEVDHAVADREEEPTERLVPISAAERLGLLTVIGGGLVAIIGSLLPWAKDAGVISSWARAADESLPGQSMSGVAGSGGSFFGILVVVFAIFAILAATRPLVSFGQDVSKRLNQAQGVLLAAMAALIVVMFVLNVASVGFDGIETVAMALFAIVAVLIAVDTWINDTPRLGADGALICSIVAFALPIGYLLARAPAGVDNYSDGIGLWITLIGGLVAVGGSLYAIRVAPYTPQRPLSTGISIPSSIGAVVALLLVWGGGSAAWSVDERAGFRNREFFGGLSSDGPALGWPTLLFAIAALIGALLLSVSPPANEARRWQLASLITGLGAAVLAIPLAWAFTVSRNGDADYFNDETALTGAGVLLALAGGFILSAIGRSGIKDFRRQRIYADIRRPDNTASSVESVETATDLVGAQGHKA